jgi:hypothetical protein
VGFIRDVEQLGERDIIGSSHQIPEFYSYFNPSHQTAL